MFNAHFLWPLLGEIFEHYSGVVQSFHIGRVLGVGEGSRCDLSAKWPCLELKASSSQVKSLPS